MSDVDTIDSGAAWAPSPRYLMLGGAAPLFTSYVQFRFTRWPAAGTGASTTSISTP